MLQFLLTLTDEEYHGRIEYITGRSHDYYNKKTPREIHEVFLF